MQLVPGNKCQVSKCVVQQVYGSIGLEEMSLSSLRVIIHVYLCSLL